MQVILDVDSISPVNRNKIGGKAEGLYWLEKNNFKTPPWCVIPSDITKKFLLANEKQIFNILSETNLNNCKEKSAEIIKIIDKTELPTKIINENISTWLKKIKLDSSSKFIVRSSMIGEDGNDFSFAGQLDSYPNIVFGSLIPAIKKCIISCFGHRVLHYKLKNNINLLNSSMAVILQQMIFSDQSGVSFTINPNTNNKNELYISSAFGDCEGVVQGVSDCDTYIVNKKTFECSKNIEQKSAFVNLEQSSDVLQLDDNLSQSQVLNSKQINVLTEKLINIESGKGGPQDVEWAFKNDQLYFYQTRPVTVKGKLENLRTLVFDNSNIQESYCGITLPLTFSLASDCYRIAYSQLMKFMGFSNQEIEKNNFRHSNMLSYIDGRVYYNIKSWYDGLKFLPSFGRNKEDMEQMMGVEHPVHFVEDVKLSGLEKFKIIPKLFSILFKLVFNFIKIDKIFNNFNKSFWINYDVFTEKLNSDINESELLQISLDLKKKFLENWAAPLVNDFYVMTKNGSVRKMLLKIKMEDNLSQLISGEDLESVKPTYEIKELARQLQACNRLNFNESINLEMIEKADSELGKKIKKFLSYYGDRCVGELKLETITYKNNPQKLINLLVNYTVIDSSQNTNLRDEAEQKVFIEIKKQLGSIALMRFKLNLKSLRKGVKYREHMRMHRTRIVGLFRDVYNLIGQSFANKLVINESRDIFYLTSEEVQNYICAKSSNKCLKALIELRKKEFVDFDEKTPLSHMKSNFPFYKNIEYLKDLVVDENNNLLSGLGCYPGLVESEVVVLDEPNESINIKNKILCTVRTDPGWAPLFPMIKGLIVEKGSALSHSAVIAREMGLPTIVGVPDVTRILKTGSIVKLNGKSGEINVIKR